MAREAPPVKADLHVPVTGLLKIKGLLLRGR